MRGIFLKGRKKWRKIFDGGEVGKKGSGKKKRRIYPRGGPAWGDALGETEISK